MPLGNLRMQAQRAGGSGPWSAHSRTMGTHVGGDGQGFSYFISDDGTSWSSG